MAIFCNNIVSFASNQGTKSVRVVVFEHNGQCTSTDETVVEVSSPGYITGLRYCQSLGSSVKSVAH